VLEVENYANTQTRDPEVIQHQPAFVVADFVNYFGIYDDGAKRNQIGNKEPNLLPFVEHIERRLLLERNLPKCELDYQRVFIRLLNQPVTNRVQNLNCAADDLKNLVFKQERLTPLPIIRVH
jgi:hypothetical protein